MRLADVQNLRGGTRPYELLHHLASKVARILDLAIELAVGEETRTAFTELNDSYVARHGFPFIIAVRDNTKASILAAFERRLDHDSDSEFEEACRQVERIAEHRLKDMLPR